MLLTHIWGDSTFLPASTISGVFHDRWDTQAVDLVSALHFTENFHSFDVVVTAVAWWTYSIWGDNVSKLFVEYYAWWFGSRHSWVIHFLFAFSVTLVQGVMGAVPESLTVTSFFITGRVFNERLMMCLLVWTILVSSEVMMLLFVWTGATLVRERWSQLIAEDIVSGVVWQSLRRHQWLPIVWIVQWQLLLVLVEASWHTSV